MRPSKDHFKEPPICKVNVEFKRITIWSSEFYGDAQNGLHIKQEGDILVTFIALNWRMA